MKTIRVTLNLSQTDLNRARRFARESGANLSLDETVSVAIGRLNDNHAKPAPSAPTKRKALGKRSRSRHPGKRPFLVWLKPAVKKAATDRCRFSELSFDAYVGALIRLNNPEQFPETRLLASMPTPETPASLSPDLPGKLAAQIAAVAAREGRTYEAQILVFLEQAATFDATFKRHVAELDIDAVAAA